MKVFDRLIYIFAFLYFITLIIKVNTSDNSNHVAVPFEKIPLGTYVILDGKRVDDETVQYNVQEVATSKILTVSMTHFGPLEGKGTKFTVDQPGSIEFDVSTETIPEETTPLHVPDPTALRVISIPDGDYEFMSVSHTDNKAPDGKTTEYVYKLKDLKTQKVIEGSIWNNTGYADTIPKRFHLKRVQGRMVSIDAIK